MVLERTYDPGAQNERTSLAWTRTALALFVGVVLAARLAADPLGVFALGFGVLVAPLAIIVLLLARRRYRHAHDALHREDALPDGRLPALVAVVTMLLAALELAYALIGT